MTTPAADAVAQIHPWIGPGIQAGAIVVSAIVAVFLIRTNRAIARKRAALDFIVHQQTDGDMLQARNRFVGLKKKGDLTNFASEEHRASEEAADIRFILNMYEAVAIGIKEGAYDEKIYKDWGRTTAVMDWCSAKGFISAYQREHNPKLYENYEAMVRRWATPSEKKHI